MDNVKTLSGTEIVTKYDITNSQFEQFVYVKKNFVPIYGYRKNNKPNIPDIPVYEDAEVDSFFNKLGITKRKTDKPIVSLTDAAVILNVPYYIAKRLIKMDARFKRLIIDIKYKHYQFRRDDILTYKADVLDIEGVPKEPSKKKITSATGDFNSMAQAFIRAADCIRPRMATCGDIISSVRTDGEWGIGI
jgi:hypothetical protein